MLYVLHTPNTRTGAAGTQTILRSPIHSIVIVYQRFVLLIQISYPIIERETETQIIILKNLIYFAVANHIPNYVWPTTVDSFSIDNLAQSQ